MAFRKFFKFQVYHLLILFQKLFSKMVPTALNDCIFNIFKNCSSGVGGSYKLFFKLMEMLWSADRPNMMLGLILTQAV